MSQAASSDDGYRAQLVELASTHAGIYRRALDTLYAGERETLSQEQAAARAARDERLFAERRERERKQRMRAELEHAGTLAEAAELAEAAARALREHTWAKLVRVAGSDTDLRRRLVKLANKRKGIYAEALAELEN